MTGRHVERVARPVLDLAVVVHPHVHPPAPKVICRRDRACTHMLLAETVTELESVVVNLG